MKKPLALTLVGSAVLTAIVVSALWPHEFTRVSSPDGRHVAVVHYRAYEGWLPIFPGASGDKSGWVTVFTKEGKKRGPSVLDMVSDIQGLRWYPEAVWVPGHGEIRL